SQIQDMRALPLVRTMGSATPFICPKPSSRELVCRLDAAARSLSGPESEEEGESGSAIDVLVKRCRELQGRQVRKGRPARLSESPRAWYWKKGRRPNLDAGRSSSRPAWSI